MKKYLILLLGILLSCKDYSIPIDTKPIMATEFKTPTILSLEDAQTLAINLRFSINSGNVTKSGNLSILEIVPIVRTHTHMHSHAHTRGNDECSSDTAIYVVNFADDNGYVILDAKLSSDYPVLSIADKGNYDVEDPEVNPGASIVLTNVLAAGPCPCGCTCLCPCTSEKCACGGGGLYPNNACNCSCACTQGGGGDLGFPDPDEHVDDFDKPIAPTHFTYYEYSDWEVLYRRGDLILSKWGQGHPYNSQLDAINGQKPMTGCVTTAVAQILGTAKYPPMYDWDLMISDSDNDEVENDLGHLFREVGRQLGITYGLNESSTNEKLLCSTLDYYGFESSPITKYSSATFMDQIDNGKKIYVSGCQYVDETWWGHTLGDLLFVPIYQGKHAWVIDGYLKMKQTRVEYARHTNEPVDTVYFEKYLFHYNFGMDGNNDGYYPIDSFDIDDNYGDMGLYEIGGVGGVYRTPMGEEGNYLLDVKMVTDIYYKN